MQTHDEWLTITLPLYRVRSQHVTFQTQPPALSTLPPPPKPLKIARLLAMAHVVAAQVAAGELENYEAAAERYRVSKPRISQIMDLMLLAPDIQEQILFFTVTCGDDPISERDVRVLFHQTQGQWAAQRLAWNKILTARALQPPAISPP